MHEALVVDVGSALNDLAGVVDDLLLSEGTRGF